MSIRICLPALLLLAVWARTEGAGPQPLDAEQITAAEFAGGFSVPSPAEVFSAFNKPGKPDWGVHARRQPAAAHTSRPLIALNLGVRIADGFLAAEAQDRQQVKNVSLEIKLLAKSLGLEQELTGRSNSIAAFADNRQWATLQEELEAVQGELGTAMDERHDGDLAELMLLGCWLRTAQIACAQLAEEKTPGRAAIIRQPELWNFFAARIGRMPPKLTALPVIVKIQDGLRALRDPAEAPASADFHSLTSGMIEAITAPEK